jgi:pimeloyl-ACP methyl ester carboxylesterase
VIRTERPVFRPAVLVLLAVLSACSPAPDVTPPAPAPPPPPPGGDDIAYRSTPAELSVDDADEILTKTEIFDTGHARRRLVYAWNVIVDQPDAPARMRAIAARARPAGQLLALAALQTLDPAAAHELEQRLAGDRREIFVEPHGPTHRTVAELVGVIRDQQLARAWRRARYDYPRIAPRLVMFPAQDGWNLFGDLYGTGERGLVLVHGGRFTKESWSGLATQFANAGFRVLAIDLRGFGLSVNGPAALNPGFGSPLDALAAIRHLRGTGVSSVSIVGASMGADAAAGASILAKHGEIDRIVLLAGSADQPADQLKGSKLFIVAREDANAAGPRLPAIRRQYERAPGPKELLILDGDAHAQFLFQSDQQERLRDALFRFLGVSS